MVSKLHLGFVVAVCFALTACSPNGKSSRAVPLPPGADPSRLFNSSNGATPVRILDARPHYLPAEAAKTPSADGPDRLTGDIAVRQYRAEQRQANQKPQPKPGAHRDFLVLAGIGSRSLYEYGVLCGWADSGTMPDFDVITGVGGGAHAAVVLFAGKEYLSDLRRIFLGIDQRRILHGDAWDAKRFPHPLGIGTPSVATTKKIRELTRPVLDDVYFAKVVAEHAKGRRLYIGTTNLDTERFVVWDMGAIASEGTAESRKLFEDVLIASTAVPPLLEPSRIVVNIDGTNYEEMHVDGGMSHGLFWHPPSDWPGDDEDRKTGYCLLAGARVHVVLGGKVQNDPGATKPKLGDVTLRSMKAMMFSIVRADLAELYSVCADRDMKLRVAAIPDDYGPMFPTDEFDKAKTQKLFCEGYTRGCDGRAWDERPPERAMSQDAARQSTILSTSATVFCPPAAVLPSASLPAATPRP